MTDSLGPIPMEDAIKLALEELNTTNVPYIDAHRVCSLIDNICASTWSPRTSLPSGLFDLYMDAQLDRDDRPTSRVDRFEVDRIRKLLIRTKFAESKQ